VSLFDRFRKDESGNSYVFILIIIPVAFALFGISMDAILYAHVKSSVQSSADAAATSAANSLYGNGIPNTVLNNVTIRTETVYNQNLQPIEKYLDDTVSPAYSVCPSGYTKAWDLKKTGIATVTVKAVETIDFMFLDGLGGIINDESQLNAIQSNVRNISTVCVTGVARGN